MGGMRNPCTPLLEVVVLSAPPTPGPPYAAARTGSNWSPTCPPTA
ncbi:hypothetical protein ACU686_41480 [Yinghuangia aomiensis]